jgi:GTP cyclohydrolase II
MHVPHRVIRPQIAVAQPEAAEAAEANANDDRAVIVASTSLPTRHGLFHTHVFRSSGGSREGDPHDLGREHVALVYGDIAGKRAVPVRVHSECLTSEVFGSLKCDCKEQLDAAMAEIARRGAGAILYLRQEGRGIGLANKIRAYALQSDGHDTVDANRMLGLPDDARRYDVARDMLEVLGVESVRLMTNNPDKVSGLRALGVDVVGTLPVVVAATAHSVGYLEAKRLRMAHDLPARGVSALPPASASTLACAPQLRAASGDAE